MTQFVEITKRKFFSRKLLKFTKFLNSLVLIQGAFDIGLQSKGGNFEGFGTSLDSHFHLTLKVTSDHVLLLSGNRKFYDKKKIPSGIH